MATLPWPALIPAEQRGNNQVMSKKSRHCQLMKKQQPVLHPKVHEGKCQIKTMGFSKYEENVYQSVLQSDAKIRF